MIRLSSDELINLTIGELEKFANRYAYLHNKNVEEVKREVIEMHIKAVKGLPNRKDLHHYFDNTFIDNRK